MHPGFDLDPDLAAGADTLSQAMAANRIQVQRSAARTFGERRPDAPEAREDSNWRGLVIYLAAVAVAVVAFGLWAWLA